MKFITNLESEQFNNSIVTLGKFDGNHIGHQLLFNKAIDYKKENLGYKVVIFTFDIPVAKVVSNEDFQTILSHEERPFQKYFDGIDYLVEFPFNEETRNMSPKDFVKNILIDKLDTKAIIVGEDFCFGKDREGNVNLLKELGKKYDFDVFALEKVKYKPNGYETEVEVSSTLIKEELTKGNLEDVNAMLGTPFSILSKVLHGKHVGKSLGFPTINFIVPDEKIMPPNGVYATKTFVDGKEYLSITNVGNRPTFNDGNKRTVETYIFDFDLDIYNKNAKVKFYKFIRPEKKFSNVDELKEEIKNNVISVRKYFE